MKAPDKVYVMPMKTSENQDAFVGLAYESDKLLIDKTEYIRKDALLEWLEQELTQRRQWFERYEDAEDLHACNELTKIINKLDEM